MIFNSQNAFFQTLAVLKLSPHEVLRILKQRSFLETFVKDHGTTLGISQILTTCANSGKYQLLAYIDKHAPLKAKRTGKKKSPCIIYKLIRKLRKRAETSWKRKRAYWAYLKASRNKVNNSVKYAKGKYFNDNLTANKKDPRKTW